MSFSESLSTCDLIYKFTLWMSQQESASAIVKLKAIAAASDVC